MKNSNIFLSLLATGLAAATFAILSNVVFPEALRADKLMAAAYSIGILLFAVRDYARRPKSIDNTPSARLLRPVLKVTLDARKPRRERSGDRVACLEQGAA